MVAGNPAVGRPAAFDYLCLLFSVRAVAAHPRPSLILLAYAVAGIIGLVPITPGGLGIVEASLSGLLVLAGLTGVQAVLATLAYRLASYWLPLAPGPFAYGSFKYRYRDPHAPPPVPGGALTHLRSPAPPARISPRYTRAMRIAVGSDHAGFDLKTALAEHVAGAGHQVERPGNRLGRRLGRLSRVRAGGGSGGGRRPRRAGDLCVRDGHRHQHRRQQGDGVRAALVA